MKKDLKYRILENSVELENGCRVWLLYKDTEGYGRVKISGKLKQAHRVSYEIFKGEIPPGMLVCHTCDNPSCCNPDHLFIGTHRDNTLDMVKKERNINTKIKARVNAPMNARNYHKVKKIDEETVRLIRTDTNIVKNIALRYGMSESQVNHIRYNESYKSII